MTYALADAVKTRPRGHDGDAVEAQIRQLDHPAYHERIRAQAALIRQGKSVLTPVTAALENPKTDPIARRHLLWVLDALAGGITEATYPLIGLLKSPVADLRAESARALGEQKVPIAGKPLEALLRDREPSVRLQAVIAPGRIGRPRRFPPCFPFWPTRTSIWPFGAPGAEAHQRLEGRRQGAGFTRRSGSAPGCCWRWTKFTTCRRQALANFAASAKRSVEEERRPSNILPRSIVSRAVERPLVGHAACKPEAASQNDRLGGHTRVMTALRELVSDRLPAVRIAAVQAIVSTGDRESSGILRARFIAEKDASVKRAIALGLGKLGDADSLDMLTSVLRDPKADQPLMDAAIEAVEKIGSKKAAVHSRHFSARNP